MVRRNVYSVVDDLLRRQGSVTSGEVARALRITRQAAHRHLRASVERGELVLEGSGRGARYRARVPTFDYAIAGAAEDRIAADVDRRLPALAELGEDEHRVLDYALAEMVNNALEHSGGTTVRVRIALAPREVELVVADDGVGALERVRSARGLSSHVEAAADLTKGKITTMPESHSGQGIFFTSKAAAYFELSANGHALIVDSVRDDVAILEAAASPGTRVVVRIARPPRRTLRATFEAYTDEDLAFSRTHTIVRLFGLGLQFVARSEARRLMAGLETFRHVVLDFDRVPGIGQGFADEVFRVFARAHPEITLEPIRMNDDVRFFVERARRPP